MSRLDKQTSILASLFMADFADQGDNVDRDEVVRTITHMRELLKRNPIEAPPDRWFVAFGPTNEVRPHILCASRIAALRVLNAILEMAFGFEEHDLGRESLDSCINLGGPRDRADSFRSSGLLEVSIRSTIVITDDRPANAFWATFTIAVQRDENESQEDTLALLAQECPALPRWLIQWSKVQGIRQDDMKKHIAASLKAEGDLA